MWLKAFINVSVSIASFLLTFYTVVNFMFFLSDPNYYGEKFESQKDNSWNTISWSLLVNMSLLSLFIFTHSVLFALPEAKKVLSSVGLDVLQRSLYTIVTSLILLLLIKHWKSIPEMIIWKFDSNYKLLWWSYILIHVFSWLVIYTGNICRDVTELIGIKQVYYNLRNWPDPNTYKSLDLRQLDNHMRHPSFIGFVLLFWFIPIMSLDRLLLALILTLYMFIAWRTDDRDYQYQKMQYQIKYYELNKLE